MAISSLGLYEDELQETINDCGNLLDALQIESTIKNDVEDRVQDYLKEYGDWSNISASVQEAYYEVTKSIVEQERPAIEMYYEVNGRASGISLKHNAMDKAVEYHGEGTDKLVELISAEIGSQYEDLPDDEIFKVGSGSFVVKIDEDQKAIFAVPSDAFIQKLSESFENTSLSISDYVDGWLDSPTRTLVLDFSKDEPALLLDNADDNVAMNVPLKDMSNEIRNDIYGDMVALASPQNDEQKALIETAMNYFSELEDRDAERAMDNYEAEYGADGSRVFGSRLVGEPSPEKDVSETKEQIAGKDKLRSLAMEIADFSTTNGAETLVEGDNMEELVNKAYDMLSTKEGRESLSSKLGYIEEVAFRNGLSEDEQTANYLQLCIDYLPPMELFDKMQEIPEIKEFIETQAKAGGVSELDYFQNALDRSDSTASLIEALDKARTISAPEGELFYVFDEEGAEAKAGEALDSLFEYIQYRSEEAKGAPLTEKECLENAIEFVTEEYGVYAKFGEYSVDYQDVQSDGNSKDSVYGVRKNAELYAVINVSAYSDHLSVMNEITDLAAENSLCETIEFINTVHNAMEEFCKKNTTLSDLPYEVFEDCPESFEELDLHIDYSPSELTPVDKGVYLLDMMSDDLKDVVDRVKELEGGNVLESADLSNKTTDVFISKDRMEFSVPELCLRMDVPLTIGEKESMNELVSEKEKVMEKGAKKRSAPVKD